MKRDLPSSFDSWLSSFFLIGSFTSGREENRPVAFSLPEASVILVSQTYLEAKLSNKDPPACLEV